MLRSRPDNAVVAQGLRRVPGGALLERSGVHGQGPRTHKDDQVVVRQGGSPLAQHLHLVQEGRALRLGQEVGRLPALVHWLEDGQHLQWPAGGRSGGEQAGGLFGRAPEGG
jgi:hypothetical protein